MQLRYLTTALPASDGLCKVTSIAWSLNNHKFAVVTMEKVVYLFDAATGERKDKFSTKPAEKGDKNYMVQALCFSPDSTRLAIAQSDNIVFVYKIGLEWGDKKSICNKFIQGSSITCMTWPTSRPNDIVFGLADGKVKIGQLRTNKPGTLYTTGSYVCSMCSHHNGNAFLSGHQDQNIYCYDFDNASSGNVAYTKIAVHSCIPYALGWGENIVAAGSDRIVTFYDREGGTISSIDYSQNEEISEFTTAAFNPSGETVVLGNFNCFITFNLQPKRKIWGEVGIKKVENLYTVTAIAWKYDGSRLAVGSLCGAADLYDACIRRYRYRGKFEFTYVSLSQVIVRKISTGERVVIRSESGYEITKMNIFQDRYLVANSTDTLLLGDLNTSRLSEVFWRSTGNEKYIFENENICIVFQSGELSLVEYGQNHILGSVRTEHMSAHLLSVRISERPPRRDGNDLNDPVSREEAKRNNKKMAYLLDLQTLCVKDLYKDSSTIINHDASIDWLELNGRGNLLLFRDKRRQLHLYEVESQDRTTLLNHCSYVQWVPDSDVVVAQSRNNLHVWYNIRAPDQPTLYQIKGDVEQIERLPGKSEVITDDGIQTNSYLLDESLIAFGTAIDDQDLVKAVSILEPLELTPETEAMWKQLTQCAIAAHDHKTAERCTAALGDVARCRYLHKINKLAFKEAQRLGGGIHAENDSILHWNVHFRLLQLKKEFRIAEEMLLQQGKVDEVLEMYQTLHKWEEAIRVADKKNHADKDVMKRSYFDYLLSSHQEAIAANLKEKEKDFTGAINLYLKCGLPAKAAQLLQNKANNITRTDRMYETVAISLYQSGLYEKAGELLEYMQEEEKALESYIKGNSYRKALELARKHFPKKVIELEEAWGDYLIQQNQIDMAINHYIEANVPSKALDAAILSRQWTKATQLVETLDAEDAKKYYRRLAVHYRETQNYELAETCFIRGGAASDAVEMYTQENKWEAAHKVAVNYMKSEEVNELYMQEAQRQEAKGRYKEAERLYITIAQPDAAIAMYKKHKMYDQMIRLVSKYQKDLLKETHIYLAQKLESENNLKEAETHYTESGEWQTAVNMYRSHDMWEDAVRIAKYYGGANASKKVAYAWAMSLGGEQGTNLLKKLGLVESAIDYAIESGVLEHAFELARMCAPKKLSEVYLKHAMLLEDEEKYPEAEEEFIQAGKPREAIDMYIHIQDWKSAVRVAEKYDPQSISDINIAQGKVFLEKRDYQKAESLFIAGGKPDLAITVYIEVEMWEDALRLARRYSPDRVNQISAAYQKGFLNGGIKTKDDLLKAGKLWENTHQYSQAIDVYMSVTPEQMPDIDELTKIWEKAAELASTYEHSRYTSVVESIAHRCQEMKMYNAAAEKFKAIGKMKDAVDCYILDQKWEEARAICKSDVPDLLQRVEKAYYAYATENGSAEEKQQVGDTDSAINLWIQRGDWKKVLETAMKQGPKAYSKYLGVRCRRLWDEHAYDEAIEEIIAYEIPLIESIFPIVEESVRKFISCSKEEETEEHNALLQKIVSTLQKIINKMKTTKEMSGNPSTGSFGNLCLICHYLCIIDQCSQKNLKSLAAKTGLSLLRYVDILSADKAFYLAGVYCRQAKLDSAAFVCFNRYLDLAEAIEESPGSNALMLENTDFLGTEILSPDQFNVPDRHYISDESSREEVREWVLAISMDQKMTEKLPDKPCSHCAKLHYEGNLKCINCQTSKQPCIVTGFPVEPKNAISCTECSSVADREDWNKWNKEFGMCPWCKSAQKPSYQDHKK